MPLDPFLGGPMPGKDAAMGEIRLVVAGQFGPILDLPLMAATAMAQAVGGNLFDFEYHPPCPHEEDEPCNCSPALRHAALRLEVLPDPVLDGPPATDRVRLTIQAGGAIKLNELQIGLLPPECRPARHCTISLSLADIWRVVGPELAAYITGRPPAEPAT